MRRCKIDGCTQVHYGKDLCRAHYRWFIERGHDELPPTKCVVCAVDLVARAWGVRFCGNACRMKWHRQFGCYRKDVQKQLRGGCAVAGCANPIEAKGMCTMHRIRVMRHGDPEAYFARRAGGPCSVQGCERPAVCKNLCEPHYMRQYLHEHRIEINANVNARRERVACQTPPWADMKEIRKVYVDCAKLTLATGNEHHVDHVVPIKGRNVSGLHVPWNLQVLPGAENRKKSNKLLMP